MAVLIKTLNGTAYASVKTRNGTAVASIKTINGTDVTSSGGALTLTYLTNATDGTDATNYSYVGQNIGAAGDRDAVVILSFGRSTAVDNLSVSSLTVDGNAGTLRHGQVYADTGTASIYGAIHTAVVAAGTSATVAVNYSAACIGACIFVYTIKNAASLVPAFTNGTGASSASNLTLDCSAPSGDSVMIGGGYAAVAVDVTFTWAGLTKDADVFWDTTRNASSAKGTYSTNGIKSISFSVGASSVLCGLTASFQ